MFKRGYDAGDFTADVNKFGAKNDIKALKRALGATRRSSAVSRAVGSGTIVLPDGRLLHAVLPR